MVLMVISWHYRMPFDAHGCVSTLVNVIFNAKILIERYKSIYECIFAFMSLRLALMIIYFLVMNSKRCNKARW